MSSLLAAGESVVLAADCARCHISARGEKAGHLKEVDGCAVCPFGRAEHLRANSHVEGARAALDAVAQDQTGCWEFSNKRHLGRFTSSPPLFSVPLCLQLQKSMAQMTGQRRERETGTLSGR